MSVKILIDSASDLSKQEAQNLGFSFLPIKVQFDDTEYLDGIDLHPETFYEKLQTAKTLPKTSLINEYTFEEEFDKLTQNGDEVVAITLSSKLSGTYNAAKNAASHFNSKVFVVDSLNATMGEQILGLHALNLAKKGLSAYEIACELEIVKHKIKVIAMIDTLKYLKMGGRISGATAFVGEILMIKPLISVIDGEVKVIGKARGSKKAMLSIIDQLNQTNGINFDMPHGLLLSGSDDTNLKQFHEKLKTIYGKEVENINIGQLGCTIGCHIGPGAVGIIYFEK